MCIFIALTHWSGGRQIERQSDTQTESEIERGSEYWLGCCYGSIAALLSSWPMCHKQLPSGRHQSLAAQCPAIHHIWNNRASIRIEHRKCSTLAFQRPIIYHLEYYEMPHIKMQRQSYGNLWNMLQKCVCIFSMRLSSGLALMSNNQCSSAC